MRNRFGMAAVFALVLSAGVFSPVSSSAPPIFTLTTEAMGIRSDIRVEATEFIYNEEDKKGVSKKPLNK